MNDAARRERLACVWVARKTRAAANEDRLEVMRVLPVAASASSADVRVVRGTGKTNYMVWVATSMWLATNVRRGRPSIADAQRWPRW